MKTESSLFRRGPRVPVIWGKKRPQSGTACRQEPRDVGKHRPRWALRMSQLRASALSSARAYHISLCIITPGVRALLAVSLLAATAPRGQRASSLSAGRVKLRNRWNGGFPIKSNALRVRTQERGGGPRWAPSAHEPRVWAHYSSLIKMYGMLLVQQKSYKDRWKLFQTLTDGIVSRLQHIYSQGRKTYHQ